MLLIANKEADLPISPLASTLHKFVSDLLNQTFMSGCLAAPVCAFSARGPGTETTMNINENTVLVFENVDLNVCGGYDNTTGNVTLYCKMLIWFSVEATTAQQVTSRYFIKTLIWTSVMATRTYYIILHPVGNSVNSISNWILQCLSMKNIFGSTHKLPIHYTEQLYSEIIFYIRDISRKWS